MPSIRPVAPRKTCGCAPSCVVLSWMDPRPAVRRLFESYPAFAALILALCAAYLYLRR